jgi:non-ribosomal peptide synthetase component F/acyl carrier protein
LRATVVRLGTDDHLVLISIHHLVADLWSIALLIDDVSAAYRALARGEPARLPPLAAQPADIGIRQRQRLTPNRVQALRALWRARLAGVRPVELPADHPRPALPNLGAHVHEFVLDDQLSQDLRRLSQAEGVTLFVTLLAGLAALIARWSGQHDLVVVSVSAGRRGRDAERVIGMLTECLVLRVDCAGDPTFRELLSRTRTSVLDAFDGAELPFAEIVAHLDPGRDLEPSPLRQIGLSVHNTPRATPSLPGLTLDALPVAPAGSPTGISEADLWLEVFDDGQAALRARLQMDDTMFEPASLRLTAHRLTTLLRDAVGRPTAHLSDLAVVGCEEQRLRARFTGGPVAAVGVSAMDGTPDAVALAGPGWAVSYRCLRRLVRRAVGQLRRAGVRPGDAVRVDAPWQPLGLVATLAVLQAGANPVAEVPPSGTTRLVLDGDVCALWTDRSGQATGDAWSALLATATDVGARLGAAAGGHWLVCPTPGQPPDPVELLTPLLAGGTLVLAEEGPPDARWAGSVVFADAGVLAGWLGAGWLPPPGVAVLTGPGLPVAAAALLSQESRLWVRYRPAGAVGWATLGRITGPADFERGRSVYGSALGPAGLRLVGPRSAPVPVGVAGEICLADQPLPTGPGWRPAAVAERAVPDPDGHGTRLWRTGEYGRFRGDGVLEAGGATDGCFEIGGRWVVAPVAEAALCTLAGVREALLVRRMCETDGGVVVPTLVAYVVPAPGIAAEQLRRSVRAHLRAKATATVVVCVDALLRGEEGTWDRDGGAAAASIPGPDPADDGPDTPTTRAVARLVEVLVGVEGVTAGDNFFRLGGTSLDATRLVARIHRDLGVEISLYALVTARTIAGIARHVERATVRTAG